MITEKIRFYSKEERDFFSNEVSNKTQTGFFIAEKIRKFVCFHNRFLNKESKKRFHKKKYRIMIDWMRNILIDASSKYSPIGIRHDPGYIDALLYLNDSFPDKALKIFLHQSLNHLKKDLLSYRDSKRAKTKSKKNINFKLKNLDSDLKTSKGIVIFSPNPYSLYTSLIISLCFKINLKIEAIILKKFTFKRFFEELKRDGFSRLTKKILRKLILKGDENKEKIFYSQKMLHEKVTRKSPNLNRVCKKNNISLLKVKRFEDSENFLKKYDLDLALFTGGGMISEKIINIFKIGIINVHMGSLPKFKGMDVVENSLISGEEVALTSHLMTKELDAGPIIDKWTFSSDEFRNLGEMRNYLTTFIPLLSLESALMIFSGSPLENQEEQGRQFYRMNYKLIDLINNILSERFDENKKNSDFNDEIDKLLINF